VLCSQRQSASTVLPRLAGVNTRGKGYAPTRVVLAEGRHASDCVIALARLLMLGRGCRMSPRSSAGKGKEGREVGDGSAGACLKLPSV